ncbi:SDR family NAD(P)-dependent oxidoreductase [Niastella populi]|uniref:Daunorubicin C-13 ketoreductase n=1 Tax=Niastella populi TaxID=550983 RepID=A0A1V9FGW5_9BACT|nr:SDR family NAD(P)-dependent oxidoreductase [Niastella populi]OQP57594.1 daunorubicin C-13 ketoreductase [Niastella populi]
MARIFITGSADGLGLLAAKALAAEGHNVVLHARNPARGTEAKRKVPTAEPVLTADLSDIEATKQLAAEVNDLGSFDAVIHNAGVYQVSSQLIFAVNTLAPYILTSLIQRPERLIYLSSGMHLQGRPNFENFNVNSGRISYSDSKLHVLMLSMAVARKWPGVYSNTIDPGWVPTKMGGRGAPDNLQKGYETQVWLATGNDSNARVSGHYFHHKKQRAYNTAADDITLQEKLLQLCETITGVAFPQ